MKTKKKIVKSNLIDYSLRISILEIVLKELHRHIDIVQDEMLGVLNTEHSDGSPLSYEEVDLELKPLIEKEVELNNRLTFLTAEYDSLKKDTKSDFIRSNKLALKKEFEHRRVKMLVNRYLKMNPDRTKDDAFNEIGDAISKPPENMKRLYYYKLKESYK